MADAVELTDDAFSGDDSAPPGFRSVQGRTTLMIVVFCTAFPLFLLQIVGPQLLAFTLVPPGTPSLFNLRVDTVQAPQSVWWDNRLWVMTTTIAPGAPQAITLRPLDEAGQWDPASEIVLAAPFESALVDGDQLRLVGSNAVTTIQNRQVRTTYPRVKLNLPSQPFLHQGRLCVLDQLPSQPDLIWYDYLEGEWIDRGRVVMPVEYQTAFAALPTTSFAPRSRRVTAAGPFLANVLIAGNGNPPLVTTLPDGRVWIGVPKPNDALRLWAAIDPPVSAALTKTSAEAPADALQLDDPEQLAIWTDITVTTAGTLHSALIWKNDVALIDETSSMSPMGSNNCRLLLQTAKDGKFVITEQLESFSAEHSAAILKPDGTLLFVGSTQFSPTGIQYVELTPEGFGPIRRAGNSAMNTSRPGFWPMYLLMMQLPLLSATILGLVAHVMVERHRDRRFSFGHHTVKLASIARRGVARVIDTQLFGLPGIVVILACWWHGDVEAEFERMFSTTGFSTLLVWGLGLFLLAFLYLIGAVLFFGTLEGVWGTSPGKWLTGLRVVRTTFQPIGLFRGLIRQFLLIIDGQLSYFVAILMAACLSKSQRLGDLCADSIVVEQSSLPLHWRDPRAPLAD